MNNKYRVHTFYNGNKLGSADFLSQTGAFLYIRHLLQGPYELTFDLEEIDEEEGDQGDEDDPDLSKRRKGADPKLQIIASGGRQAGRILSTWHHPFKKQTQV